MRHNIIIILALIAVMIGGGVLSQEIPRFRIKEKRARTHFEKGLRFYHQQKYVAARELFYHALNIQPNFHLARRYLGDSYYYSGEWQGALEQWEFLNEITQNDYPLIRQRSEILRFYLNQYRRPGHLVYLSHYSPESWSSVKLKQPVATMLDDQNRLYILNFGSKNLIRLFADGSVDREFRGSFLNRFKGPVAFTILKDNIYLCDFAADEIRVFSTTGQEIMQLGGPGTAEGKFHGPSAIAATDDFYFVADSGNRRIQKFDSNGKFLLSFSRDNQNEQILYPAGMVWHEDKLYVSDRDDARILVFDKNGNFLFNIVSAHLSQPRGLFIRNQRMIVADEKTGVWFYHLTNKAWTKFPLIRNDQDKIINFSRPVHAFEDTAGRVNITDYDSSQVVITVPRGLKITNLDMKVQRVDTSSFSNIGVFVTIRNRLGQTVKGLSARDIWLFENDQRIGGVNTRNIKAYNRRLETVIVKENTPIFSNRFAIHLEQTLSGFTDKFRNADKLEVIRVGQQVRAVYSGLERKRLLRHLNEGETTSNPNIGKGLYAGITTLVKKIGPRSVLLIVSGHQFEGMFSQYSVQRIKQYALANGIRINIISFEGETEPGLRSSTKKIYQDLAMETGGAYYRAFDDSKLSKMDALMRTQIDERYILTYDSQVDEDLHNRYVDLRIEVHHMGMTGKADAGYFVP